MVGTGGTISGISAYLLPRLPNLLVVLADPQGSGLYNSIKYGVLYSDTEKEGTRRRHQVDSLVEGIGLNRSTRNFEKGRADIHEAVKVTDAMAVGMGRWLIQNDGSPNTPCPYTLFCITFVFRLAVGGVGWACWGSLSLTSLGTCSVLICRIICRVEQLCKLMCRRAYRSTTRARTQNSDSALRLWIPPPVQILQRRVVESTGYSSAGKIR